MYMVQVTYVYSSMYIYIYIYIRNKSTIYLTGHFHYYLVSYNTTGVLHSSDEMTECGLPHSVISSDECNTPVVLYETK